MQVIKLPSLYLVESVYALAWDRHGQLISSNLPGVLGPFDSLGWQSSVPIFRDVYIDEVHLRVLSVPLEVGGHLIGKLQLASSLAVVDATLGALVPVLLVGAIISLAVAGLVGWVGTPRARAPPEG